MRAMTTVAPCTELMIEHIKSKVPNNAVENVQRRGRVSHEIGIGKNRLKRAMKSCDEELEP